MHPIVYTHWKSPLGRLLIAAQCSGIICISFTKTLAALKQSSDCNCIALEKSGAGEKKAARHLKFAQEALLDYFAGREDRLNAIAIDPRGTEFQVQVWKAMRTIRSGRPESYGALAKKVGRPQAARAVGAACRTNPIVIVVPCHRVIGSDRSLTGFAAGMHRKIALLEHEGYTV